MIRGEDHIGVAVEPLLLQGLEQSREIIAAFLIAASEVGPLIPGIRRPRLSP